MATPAKISKHAGEAEYLRERTRMEAERIAADVEVDALDGDADAIASELLEELLRKIEPLLDAAAEEARAYAFELGYGDLSEAEIEEILDEAQDGLILYLALPALVRAVQAAQDTLSVVTAGKLTAAAIAAVMVPVTSILRGIGPALVADFERAIMYAAQSATVEADEVLTWQTVNDGKVCNDEIDNSCDPRHGYSQTLEEWEEMGLPGSGNLLCSMYAKVGSNCRCVLERDSGEAFERVNVSDAITEGRQRARTN